MTAPPQNKTNLRRHLARQCAMQAIYQWQHTQHSPGEIIQQFMDESWLEQADQRYFSELVNGVVAHVVNIDDLLVVHLDRPLSQLNPVEWAIMRVAVFELQHSLHVPFRVVINEALEIAKIFGADQGHKYVNAILDQLAPKLRVAEAAVRSLK